MSARRRKIRDAIAIGLFAYLPGQANAHAFGGRYDLPLPLDLYLIGAACAVTASFVIMSLVISAPNRRARPPSLDIAHTVVGRLLLHRWTTRLTAGVSLFFLTLVLASGFFGQQDVLTNFAPTFVWVVWWIGLVYVAALIGNVWPAFNPWSAGFILAERALPLLSTSMRAYPAWLGAWPAVILFAIFAWLELVFEPATVPMVLAALIVGYSIVTWIGMAVFGRKAWLSGGEAFSIAFEMFGRFAPIGRPCRDPEATQLELRPYAGDLIIDKPLRFSSTVFVLLMLATVSYDGVKETPHWATWLEWMASLPLLSASLSFLADAGFDVLVVLETVMFAGAPVVFLSIYLLFCWLVRQITGVRLSVAEIAGLFVLSLIPIAVAYHLSHYLSYLLISGQRIIPLASDPLGMGWDLFGTAGVTPDIGVVGARFVWYTALIAIVVGHIFGVGVAHFVALKVFKAPRVALRSQYPLLLLMVAYTMLSLWILAQPITERAPDLRALRTQSETALLEPIGSREVCLDMGRGDQVEFSFRADAPLRFRNTSSRRSAGSRLGSRRRRG